jgi:hypothetical protein
MISGGCALFSTGPAAPSPNNPLNTGRVPSARKFAPDRDAEKRHDLPEGSLAAEATMVSLNPSEVCFELVVRTTGERDDMASPQSWQITMEGTGPDYKSQDFQLRSTRAVEVRSYADKGNKFLGLAAQACQLSGKCSEEATNKAIYSGNKRAALTGGGVICFPNMFKPSTDYVRLRMEDKRAESHGYAERVFTWEFRD